MLVAFARCARSRPTPVAPGLRPSAPSASRCALGVFLKTTIMGNRGQGSLGGLGSYPPLARFHPLFAGGSHAPLRNILFLHAHYKGPRRTLVPPVSVSLVAARPITRTRKLVTESLSSEQSYAHPTINPTRRIIRVLSPFSMGHPRSTSPISLRIGRIIVPFDFTREIITKSVRPTHKKH